MTTSQIINRLPDELTPEVEEKLLALKEVNQGARDMLVERTLKAATRFAATLTKGQLPLDEIFSIAGMALMRSVKNYRLKKDGSKNARLLTYSKPYLRGEIIKAWRLRDPVDYGANIPDKLSEPEPDVETMRVDSAFSILEIDGPDFDLIHQHERMEMVKPHFDRLSETEQRILTLQFEARLSGVEIAKMLGCTRANIRESRNRALKKIRHALLWEGKFEA
jgi:RNA polymerase sigma factor (sigma-70 family)